MAKNYAKFVPPKSRSRKKQWRTEVVVAIFLVVTGVLAFGSFLYVERSQGAGGQHLAAVFSKLVALVHPKKITVPEKQTPAKSVAVAKSGPEPVHFDFYNELPNMQMPAEDQQTVASSTPPPKVTPAAPTEAPPALPAPVVAAAQPSSAVDEPVAVATAAPVADAAMVAAAKPAQVPVPQPAAPVKAAPPVIAKIPPPAPVFNPEEVSNLLAAEHGLQRYVIQLGVFQSQAAARQLREAIMSVGFDVVVVAVKQGNHKVYHVQQGPYESAALAKLSQQRLEKRGIISVIQKASA